MAKIYLARRQTDVSSTTAVSHNTSLMVLFVALLVYQLWGAFPFAPIEGDGVGIANGVAQMGIPFRPTPLAYRYEVQSGTYGMVYSLHKLIGLDPFTAFSLLSVVASVVFTLASATLISRLVGLAWPICGLALLVFPETLTGGYYANSTVIAAALLMLALCAVWWQVPITAGVLFSFAIWARFDAVLIAPVVPLLLYRQDKRWLYQTAVVGIVTTASAITWISFSLGSVRNLGTILAATREHLDAAHSGTGGLGIPLLGATDAKTYASFFSLLLLLLTLWGLVRIVQQRRRQLLAIIVAGCIPVLVVLHGRLTSPKYLYYLIPFLAIPVAVALARLFAAGNRKRWLLVGVAGLLALQYVVGLRASFTTKRYVDAPYSLLRSTPTFAPLVRVSLRLRSIDQAQLVLGAGALINTADGTRLSSGMLWTPLTWHAQKTLLNQQLQPLEAYLDASSVNPANLLASQWEARQLTLHLLLKHGYRCEHDARETRWNRFACTRQAQTILLNDIYYDEHSYAALNRVLAQINVPDIVVVATYSWEQDVIRQAPHWTPMGDFAYKLKHP